MFTINNQSFGKKDTLLTLNLNKTGLDSCVAIINNDTLRFLAKFKADEAYEIKQGCCCAAFTLSPKNRPRRGKVVFKNTTHRNVALVIAEANIDTVKAQETKKIVAYESAMCLFKPCSILVTETEFLSSRFDYKGDKKEYKTLWDEQSSYILASGWFHFLHGEKIQLVYNDKTKTMQMKLIGYLSDKEYKDMWK